MFNKVKVKRMEEKINDMSLWLDACIKTCKQEIEFDEKLLKVGSPETQEYATKTIEKERYVLCTLEMLRRRYDEIINKD